MQINVAYAVPYETREQSFTRLSKVFVTLQLLVTYYKFQKELTLINCCFRTRAHVSIKFSDISDEWIQSKNKSRAVMM